MISPLLASIALNSLNWLPDRQKLHFVRHANDFVVMRRTRTQAEETLALAQFQLHLGDESRSNPSSEKTHIASFSQGLAYLGFDLCSRSVTMRAKSLEKFKRKWKTDNRRMRLGSSPDRVGKVNKIVKGPHDWIVRHSSW